MPPTTPDHRAISGLFAFLILMAAPFTSSSAESNPPFQWSKLPPIPDPEGFAGSFAGVSGGALIVAGGANIAGDKWAEPLRKKWYDSIFVLEKPDGKWRSGFRLPRPLGYGVSVTTPGGIVCIGGSNAERHFADCFLIEWRDGRISTKAMPPLPKPCANMCGTLVGDAIYVAGGIGTPTATVALKTFWKLDLAAKEPRWEELEPWPGPECMLAVAGSVGGSFYLFSGVRLKPDADGKPMREYLRDAYRFTPGKGWRRIADLPRAAVAAPSPALVAGGVRLVLVSGDDGLNVNFAPVREHPGFPRTCLAYDPERDAWTIAGEVPFSIATAPVVKWRDHFVIPNGEVRPRVRTPEVWVGDAK
jgi:N-acetylneuraminic acid mutarotase